MPYYNSYLHNATKRYKNKSLNYKDLYLRELLTFKKEITLSRRSRSFSFFDIILDSYNYTRSNKLDVFTVLLPDNHSVNKYIQSSRDIIASALYLCGISDFKFDSIKNRDFIYSFTKDFISNYGALGKDTLTLDEKSGEIIIHGKIETGHLL